MTSRATLAAPPAPAPAGGLLAGMIAGTAAAVAMGSAAPALKVLAATQLSVVNIVHARAVIGAVALLGLALVLRGRRLRIARRDWWLVVVYGVVTLAVNQVVFTVAVSRIPVGVALLLEYLSPVLVALWVRFAQRKKVPQVMWLGITLVLAGLALAGQIWSRFYLDVFGVLCGLLAAVTLAGRFLLAERGLRSYDPLVLAAWGTTLSAAVLTVTSIVDPFPVAALAGSAVLGGMTVPVVVLILWVGLVGMGVAVLLGAAAQRTLPPTSANLIATVEIVAGAVLAYLVVGERLSPVQLAGALIMLGGVIAAQVAVARSGQGRPRSTR